MLQNQGIITAYLWSNMATLLFLFAYESFCSIIQLFSLQIRCFVQRYTVADYSIQKTLEQFWSSNFTSYCVIPKFTCLAIRTSLGFGTSHCAALKFESQLKYNFIYTRLLRLRWRKVRRKRVFNKLTVLPNLLVWDSFPAVNNVIV